MKAQTCVACKARFWHYRLTFKCDQCHKPLWWGMWVVPTMIDQKATLGRSR